ncbi:MAG: hypothetical protein ACOY71_10325 [Gemmatimonadota bacterium]
MTRSRWFPVAVVVALLAGASFAGRLDLRAIRAQVRPLGSRTVAASQAAVTAALAHTQHVAILVGVACIMAGATLLLRHRGCHRPATSQALERARALAGRGMSQDEIVRELRLPHDAVRVLVRPAAAAGTGTGSSFRARPGIWGHA